MSKYGKKARVVHQNLVKTARVTEAMSATVAGLSFP
jgi:hypothetical protein